MAAVSKFLRYEWAVVVWDLASGHLPNGLVTCSKPGAFGPGAVAHCCLCNPVLVREQRNKRVKRRV